MDTYIISVIVSFTPYQCYDRVHRALGSYLSAMDQQNIFDVDIGTIPANCIESYLMSIGRVSNDRMTSIIGSALRNKIFIPIDVLQHLNASMYKWSYNVMTERLSKDRLGWLRANPFPKEVTVGLFLNDIVKNTSINLIPYLSCVHFIDTAYRISGFEFIDLLKAYRNAYAPLGNIPEKYDCRNVSDDIFKVYCDCVKRRLWCPVASSGLVKRLVLATNDKIYKELRTREYDAMDMYIMAHLTDDDTLEKAPDWLIAKAYRLSKMAD